MGRNSGGVRGSSSSNQTAEEYNNKLGVTIQSIKGALLSYSQIDRRNRNTAYNMGFNDEALRVVDKLAGGNYGLASTIAKQATERSGYNNYGARFSEKQAYVLAKAVYDNKLINNHATRGAGIFRDNTKEAEELDRRQREARKARRERRKQKAYKPRFS